MKIYILLYFTFFLTLNSCEKRENKEKTLILGTRIYIEQPISFESTTDFIGFENEQGEGIMFMDLSGANYNIQAKNFTKENFERENIIVSEFKELKLGDYPAKLAVFEDVDSKSIHLLFGDDDFCVMANAKVQNDDKKIEIIKKSLLSIEYDKNRIVSPFEAAFFEIDDSKSIYKHSVTNSNMFLFTENGIKKDNFVGESAYLVIQTPLEQNSQIEPKFLFDNFLNSLVDRGLIISKRTPSNKQLLNGFNCYEELITGMQNAEETHIIMTCVTHNNRGVIISGTAKDNFELILREFEKLTNTLNMK